MKNPSSNPFHPFLAHGRAACLSGGRPGFGGSQLRIPGCLRPRRAANNDPTCNISARLSNAGRPHN